MKTKLLGDTCMMHFFRFYCAISFASFFFLYSSSSSLASSRPSNLPHLIRYTKTTQWSLKALSAVLSRLPASTPFAAKCSVDAYEVLYATKSYAGSPAVASGTLLVPICPGYDPILPLVSYQHPTSTQRNDVPSREADGQRLIYAAYYASIGVPVVAADYLGLGASPGIHPFLHAKTEASAAIDMMKAGQELLVKLRQHAPKKAFLIGYSQGGHATVALHRELQENPSHGIEVIGSAPMAGMYDLSEATLGYHLNTPHPPRTSTFYFSYTLYSYWNIYKFAPSLSDVFIPPYDRRIPELFSSNLSIAGIVERLPPSFKDVIQPPILAALKENKNHPVSIAARQNDVHQWIPRSPILFLHGKADGTAPYAGAYGSYLDMKKQGAPVKFQNVGDRMGHGTAFLPAMNSARKWFIHLISK